MKKVLTIILIVFVLLITVGFIRTRSTNDNSNTGNANMANIKSAVEEEPISDSYDITVVNTDTNQKFSISKSSSAYIASEIIEESVILRIKESAKDILLLDGMSGKTATNYSVSKLKGIPSKVVCGQLKDLTSYPAILIITTDGFVESVNSEIGFKTGKFESKGNINSLEGIKDIIPVSVELDGSTYMSLLAIDENNYAYEITQDMLK